MGMTSTQIDRETLIGNILKCATEIQSMGIEWHTGIYPSEMAAFLGLCDTADVQSIVESGRGPDAYSTHVFGEYAEKRDMPVVSIDIAPIEEHHYGDALKKYRHLTCITGNAFDVFPEVFHTVQGPVGLLIDGPKGQQALRLSITTTILYNISVIAHHNSTPTSLGGKKFAKMYPGAFYFEGLDLTSSDVWQQFRKWEKEWTRGYKEADRSLDRSSLVMAPVPSKPWKALPFVENCHLNTLRLIWKWRLQTPQQTNVHS